MKKDKHYKETEELLSKLKDLSKEPSGYPPRENAMCYCPANPEPNEPNDKNGQIRKFLIISAIIVAVSAIGIAIELVLLYWKQ